MFYHPPAPAFSRQNSAPGREAAAVLISFIVITRRLPSRLPALLIPNSRRATWPWLVSINRSVPSIISMFLLPDRASEPEEPGDRYVPRLPAVRLRFHFAGGGVSRPRLSSRCPLARRSIIPLVYRPQSNRTHSRRTRGRL